MPDFFGLCWYVVLGSHVDEMVHITIPYFIFFAAADGNHSAVAHSEGLFVHAGDGFQIDNDTMIAFTKAGIHQ